MFKHIFESTISAIESERARNIELVKQKVMQEQVLPFNREIDISLRDAISEMQNAHNERIAQMQKSFEAEKTALHEAATKKKADNAEIAISSATAEINKKADEAIARLQHLIGKEA